MIENFGKVLSPPSQLLFSAEGVSILDVLYRTIEKFVTTQFFRDAVYIFEIIAFCPGEKNL